MTLTMRAGLAALAFGIATGAQAQSTAETYLQEFLQLYAEQGMEMSYGAKTETGNGIELSDITVNLGNAQSSGTITFDSMSFTEIDDPVYEVEVRTSPEFTGTITADSGNGDMTMDMTGTVAGSLRIGGPADDRLMQMDYQAFNLTYDISQLDAQGGTGTIEMSASDIGGTMGYSLSLATQVFDMTAGAMSFGMNMSPPEGGNLDMQMTYTDITASGTAPITNMQDPAVDVLDRWRHLVPPRKRPLHLDLEFRHAGRSLRAGQQRCDLVPGLRRRARTARLQRRRHRHQDHRDPAGRADAPG